MRTPQSSRPHCGTTAHRTHDSAPRPRARRCRHRRQGLRSRQVHANPGKFRFVKITDERLTRKTASGEAVYRRAKVAPGAVEGARAVETICVKGLLLANNNKLSAEQRSRLAPVIDQYLVQKK